MLRNSIIKRTRTTKQGGALIVADCIEDLIDLVRMADFDLDCVRARHCIQRECRGLDRRSKMGKCIPLGTKVRGHYVFHVLREAFIEPESIPPAHCNEIAKPLQ